MEEMEESILSVWKKTESISVWVSQKQSVQKYCVIYVDREIKLRICI